MLSTATQEFLAILGIIIGTCFVFLTLFICHYETRQARNKRGIRVWWMMTGIGGFFSSVIPLALGTIWFYHHQGDAMDIILPLVFGWFIHWIGVGLLHHVWRDYTSNHNRRPPSRGSPTG